MDYLLVSLAALCICGQFMFNKLYEKKIVKSRRELFVFPVLTTALAALLFFCINGFRLAFNGFGFGLALLNAAVAVGTLVCGVIAVRYGRVAVYTTFMMFGGMLLPYLYGLVFLNERSSVCQMIGLALLVAALILMTLQERGSAKKLNVKFILLCTLVFLLNGGISIISKAHQIHADALPTYDFVIYTYLFQSAYALIGIALIRIFSRKRKSIDRLHGVRTKCCPANPAEELRRASAEAGTEKESCSIAVSAQTVDPNGNSGGEGEAIEKHRTIDGSDAKRRDSGLLWKAVLVCAGFAISAGTGYLLQLLAAKTLPAVVMYPFVTGGSILLSTLGARIFFRERIGAIAWIAIALLTVGTVLFIF